MENLEVFLPNSPVDFVPQFGIAEHEGLIGLTLPTSANFRATGIAEVEYLLTQSFDDTETPSSSESEIALMLLGQDVDLALAAASSPSLGTSGDPLTGWSRDPPLVGLRADSLTADESGAQQELRFGSSGNDELFAETWDIVFAGNGDDILDATATSGGNQLYGGEGEDELFAGSNDRLFGGPGNDILDTTAGTGGNRLYGGRASDTLVAGVNDRLFGGASDDVLFAGTGNSKLTGGEGTDQFWIASAELSDALNTLTDFQVGIDILGVGGLGLASFDELELVQRGADTLIEVKDSGAELAVLTGIQADALTSASFLFSLDLPGLTDEVKVLREPSGIVHIQAQNENDLFFTLGVVHAQDRLWQMDYQRRLGAGRLSEVLGEDTLQQDILTRTLGLYQAAESAYQNLAPETKQVVDDYTAGINAYRATEPTLPVEFSFLGYEPEPWQPADALVVNKIQSFGLSSNLESELLRSRLLTGGLSPERIQELLPPYPENAPTILQSTDLQQQSALPVTGVADFPELPQEMQVGLESLQTLDDAIPSLVQASNNWVVSGSRTTTGKPFLANDPHLSLQVPSVWYQAHLESPTLDVIGGTFPGLPGVLTGHNRQIAWGVTNVGADVQDLYMLEETADGAGYLYQGQVQPYQVREETIQVKDAAAVPLQVRSSVYGPVISDALGLDQPLALHWVSLEPIDGTIEAFLGINRADNWEEFKAALQSYVAPSQNFVYADVEGNISYFAPGKFPIRQPGHTGLYPIPGTGEFGWQGFIPFEQLPQVLNPESGFIVTANNKVTPKDYPYDIGGDFDEYRAERIRELILSKDKLSLEDMQAIQLDQVSLLYRDFQPILEHLDPLSERTRTWRDRLLAWDGDTQPDSVEATVFEAWYTELTRLPATVVGQEYWNQPRYLLRAIQEGEPACDQPGTEPGCLDDTAQALEAALDQLGNPVPTWGEIHQARFEQLVPVLPDLNLQVPFGGDRYTVNVGSYNPKTFIMPAGPSYRQVVDLTDLEDSLFINPPGQSGDPLSPNFDNQLLLWQQGEYLPMKTESYPVAQRLVLQPRVLST